MNTFTFRELFLTLEKHEFQNSEAQVLRVTSPTENGQHHYPMIIRASLRPEPHTCTCLLVSGEERLDKPAHIVYVTEFSAVFNFAVSRHSSDKLI
jgi:hypothetical protein